MDVQALRRRPQIEIGTGEGLERRAEDAAAGEVVGQERAQRGIDDAARGLVCSQHEVVERGKVRDRDDARPAGEALARGAGLLVRPLELGDPGGDRADADRERRPLRAQTLGQLLDPP
jgi:hypothetical protein